MKVIILSIALFTAVSLSARDATGTKVQCRRVRAQHLRDRGGDRILGDRYYTDGSVEEKGGYYRTLPDGPGTLRCVRRPRGARLLPPGQARRRWQFFKTTDGGQMELYYETGVMVSGEALHNAGGEVVEALRACHPYGNFLPQVRKSPLDSFQQAVRVPGLPPVRGAGHGRAVGSWQHGGALHRRSTTFSRSCCAGPPTTRYIGSPSRS